MRTARKTSAVLLLAALVLSACGGQEPSGSESDTATASGDFPVTVDDGLQELTIDEQPQRIVSLSPSNTEMLFAVGAGEQIIAADEHSNHPEEAPTTELSSFTPSAEAISEYDPDLVVLARDAQDVIEQLEKLKIPSLSMPAAESFDDAYEQMRLLGTATGHAEQASTEADRIESEVEDIISATKEQLGDTELSYYHELDAGMYSVTSETFIGQVYSEFGLNNIADATEDKAGGYPQLSSEFIVEENPDLVFLGYGGEDAVTQLEKRPAFDAITAVENGDVISLDNDIASRWGPRIVDLTESVSDAVLAAEEK